MNNGKDLDLAEQTAKEISEGVEAKTGMNAFNWLTVASIAVSIGLYLAGKKSLAIFIGLWPPTFQALKSATQSSRQQF